MTEFGSAISLTRSMPQSDSCGGANAAISTATKCCCSPSFARSRLPARQRARSPERREFPDLPWTEMIGMRHRLVHAYFDINRDILWTTVTEAAPPLAQRLRKILERA